MQKECCGNCLFFKDLILWPDRTPDYAHPLHCCTVFVLNEKELCGDEDAEIHQTDEFDMCELWMPKEGYNENNG